MALENDLEMVGRRLNNLEAPQNYIRIGYFLGYEEGTAEQVENINVTSIVSEAGLPPGHRHTVFIDVGEIHTLVPPKGKFLKGNVVWAEENVEKRGIAIIMSNRKYVALNRIDRIPTPVAPDDQVLLFFVSGIIFAIPIMETFLTIEDLLSSFFDSIQEFDFGG